MPDDPDEASPARGPGNPGDPGNPGGPDDPGAAVGPSGPAGPAEHDGPRADDGLELARVLRRATAGAGAAPARRRTRGGTGTGPGGAGARSGSRRNAPFDAQLSGAHPDERDPQLLGSTMDRLVAEQGWSLELRVRSLFARWSELVGDQVGDHSTPESFADGRLVVRADSTAWATQLKLLAPALVRRLAEELGDGVVTVVEVLGPQLPGPRRGGRRTRDSRGPRDTYG